MYSKYREQDLNAIQIESFSLDACGTCPGSVMIALPSLRSDKL